MLLWLLLLLQFLHRAICIPNTMCNTNKLTNCIMQVYSLNFRLRYIYLWYNLRQRRVQNRISQWNINMVVIKFNCLYSFILMFSTHTQTYICMHRIHEYFLFLYNPCSHNDDSWHRGKKCKSKTIIIIIINDI